MTRHYSLLCSFIIILLRFQSFAGEIMMEPVRRQIIQYTKIKGFPEENSALGKKLRKNIFPLGRAGLSPLERFQGIANQTEIPIFVDIALLRNKRINIIIPDPDHDITAYDELQFSIRFIDPKIEIKKIVIDDKGKEALLIVSPDEQQKDKDQPTEPDKQPDETNGNAKAEK